MHPVEFPKFENAVIICSGQVTTAENGDKNKTRMHFLPWSGILEAKKYKEKGHVRMNISTSHECINSCMHFEDWFYVSDFILNHTVFLNLTGKIHSKVYHSKI